MARPRPSFRRGAASWSCPRRFPNMRLISMQEASHELHRGQPVRRLCRAHLSDDGGGLGHHDRTASDRHPLRLAAIRLASGAVRVRRLHHRSVVLDSHYRMELVMTVTEVIPKRGKAADTPGPFRPAVPVSRAPERPRMRAIPFLLTLGTVALAGLLGWGMWEAYMGAPWTRDSTVRAYVVTMAPEVAGRIVELLVLDNKYVRKDDLLMVIDSTNYSIAVSQAEAAVQQAQATVQNVDAQMTVQQAQISSNQALLDQAQAVLVFAKQQAWRYETLAKQGWGTVQNSEQFTSQFHQQEAAVQTAQQNLNLAQRQVESLKAQRMSAEANLAQAKAQLHQA